MKIFTTSLTLAVCLCLGTLSSAETAETLYDKLGGEVGVAEIVKGMVSYSRDDKRIAHTFENSNEERLIGKITLHFCEISN